MQPAEIGLHDVHFRHAAMLQRNPIHTFMFDNTGRLLVANEAAIRASLHSDAGLKIPDGKPISLQALFRLGLYGGGQAEADAAYQEAMEAVFSLQPDEYSHVQYYDIPQTAGQPKRRWNLIELWPLQDPVTMSPAVMVKRSSITRQREMEMQLEQQQAALQRRYQDLEQDSVSYQAQKVQAEIAASAMAERLQAVLQDKFRPSSTAFDADTPIDKTLSFLQSYVQGEAPSVSAALQLLHILTNAGTRLRVPVGLETQLKNSEDLDNDVGRSMYQLLQAHVVATWHCVYSTIHKQGQARRLLYHNHCMAVTLKPCKVQGNSVILHDVGGRQEKTQLAGDTPALPTEEPALKTQDTETTPAVPHSLTPAVERLLKDAESNWQFDIFALARETPGFTLSLLAVHLHKATGFMDGLNEAKFTNYVRSIESGYLSTNPYHNSVHAASVLQLTHMILCHGGIPEAIVSPGVRLSTYWTALVHDYEHGGLNNDFLIKTSSPLALLYNDQSPLENHHCSAACKQFIKPDHFYFPRQEKTDAERQEQRATAVQQVLGTDMKKHFDITSRFQGLVTNSQAQSTIDWSQVRQEERLLVYQMVLKCADIGHLTVSPRTHRQWACQLEEEFFRQGDQEKALGLPVSPLMDRAQAGGMTRSQLGFYHIVGIPMFKAFAELFEGCKPLLDGALANYHHWEAGTNLDDLPA